MLAAAAAELKPPKRLGICEWAEASLRLPASEAQREGMLNLDHTPWLRDPLECFDDPDVRRITLCFAAQSAKTTAMRIMKARAITNNPGPILMVLPNREIARKYSKKRWRPFILESPGMRQELTGRREDLALLDQKFRGAVVILVGSNSAANLSSEPVKCLFLDEVDKYPKWSGNDEADPISLAIERVRSYDDSKIVEASTPTLRAGAIWRALESSDWRVFHAPCPRCGVMIAPTWSNFWWPPECKVGDAYDLDLVREETRLICPACDGEIRNAEKATMVAAGAWIPSRRGTPGHVGFHFRAWWSLWRSCDWGELAVRFLQAKGSPRELHGIVNSTWAEPWQVRGDAATADQILAHAGEYEESTCPVMPLRVFLTVDKQRDRWVYVVRGWCRFASSFLIQAGEVETLDELAAVARRVFPTPQGNVGIDRVYVDSGDDTLAVYRICARHGWKPVKGERSTGLSPVRSGKGQDGTRILLYDAAAFKRELQDRLAIPLHSPGAWHVHAGVAAEYARQLASEEEIEVVDRHGHEKKVWQRNYANHFLDCEIMQLVAAEVNEVRRLQSRLPPCSAPSIVRPAPTPSGHRLRRPPLPFRRRTRRFQ